MFATGLPPGGHRRLGMNDRSGLDRQPCQAAQIAQRMQSEADRGPQSAMEFGTADAALRQLGALEERGAKTEDGGQEIALGCECVHRPPAVCELELAIAAALGIDRMTADEIRDIGD